jgi:CO/xanthine dehydrogenase FAD-binding subunit
MLSPFEYHRPKDLAEALECLRQEPRALPLAGGTDLLVKMRRGKLTPPALVDIKNLQVCRGIRQENGHLSVGALTDFQELLESDLIRERYQVLHQAARAMGCYEIRRRATLGGNVANASPGAESGSPLAVLEALVELAGPDGRRRLPVAEFWQGPGRTALAPGELLVRILIPDLPPGSRGRYQRRSRVRGMDLASMNAAVVVIDPEQIETREIRIALGAVAPTPVRSGAVEEMLAGREVDEKLLERLMEEISRDLHPRASSLRASPEYKKRMAGALVVRALHELLDRP